MQRSVLSQVQIVNPLIKLVKEREEIYFQLLSFVNSHITSNYNDQDITSIFNKFIAQVQVKSKALAIREEGFLVGLADPFAEGEEGQDDPISKQMLRLFLRLLEILQASIERVRKSVFQDNGRAVKEYSHFRATFNKIIKQDFFIAKNFAEHVIGYCTIKYNKQFEKLKKYVEKVKQGDDIYFRQLFTKQKSDIESSPSPDDKRGHRQEKTVRKHYKKIDMDKHLSSTEEPQKKVASLKRTARPKQVRRLSKNRSQDYEEGDDQQPTRKKMANKLYHFYIPMELSKRQFLQDYVYEQKNEQKHKKNLMSKLLQRNKTINTQINVHVRKSAFYLPIPILILPAKNSGDQRYEKNESVASKVSLRKSFVISRRKNSHNNFQTSTEKVISKQVDPEKSTIKNINPRRRSSHSSNRNTQKSKKLVVVKPPMLFEEQMIPQAPINQTQWMHAPLTVKGRQRKGQNIRLKRKNNVNPLQNALLQQNFRYPL